MPETRAKAIDFEPLPMDEVLRIASPLRRLLGVTTQAWFRISEFLPALARGAGPAGRLRRIASRLGG